MNIFARNRSFFKLNYFNVFSYKLKRIHITSIVKKASIVNQEQKKETIKPEELTLTQQFIKKSPLSVQPYLKIIRIDNPIGNWLIIWPSTWGIALATAPNAFPDLNLLSLFITGSFLMRGAGCIINDMVDKNVDSKVERTMNRPLVNGTMSMQQATLFLGAELSLALLILLQLNNFSILLGMSSLALMVTYPFFKRITYWPQVALGLTLNWGVLLGYSAVHEALPYECLSLYLSAVSWTIIYDTIYAKQDINDDIKLGVKSTAIKFGEHTKIWLSGFSAITTSGLLCTGILTDQTWPYYAAVATVTSHLLWQIHSGDLNNPEDCARKHSSNGFIGFILFLGLVAGNLLKRDKNKAKLAYFARL